MSRIGKLPVPVPAGVEVKIDGNTVTVKGPKGELTQTFNENMAISLGEDGSIVVERPDDARENRAMHGLTRSLINNMVIGVSEGYSKTLELVGVGLGGDARKGSVEQKPLAVGHGVESQGVEEGCRGFSRRHNQLSFGLCRRRRQGAPGGRRW